MRGFLQLLSAISVQNPKEAKRKDGRDAVKQAMERKEKVAWMWDVGALLWTMELEMVFLQLSVGLGRVMAPLQFSVEWETEPFSSSA